MPAAFSPHVHIPFQRIPEYLALITAHRLNLEIYFSADCIDSLTLSELSRVQADLSYGPSLSFHAPFMDLCPAALDSRIREATMARFSQIFDVAEVLRPKAIVFHSGYEKWKYALSATPWLEKSIELWTPFIDRSKSLGITIGIENIFEDEPSNLRMLMEAVGSKHFGICFDTGHFNLFSTVPLETWLNELGKYIVELHLHDNDRSSDQHLPVGEGVFDFEKLFAALHGRKFISTIENHSPDRVLLSLNRLAALTSKTSSGF